MERTGLASPRPPANGGVAHDRHGISRLTVKKILNHAERDVTAVYDRHSYDPEKRTALEAWGRRLEEIVGGTTKRGNIVALGRATR